MRKLNEIIETVKENIAYNEELKATNHLYRALRHDIKARHISEQEKARLGELAEYTKDRIVYDLTYGEQALCLLAMLITIEAMFFGIVFGLAALFPTLNGVSDLAIALGMLVIALLVGLPIVYLVVKPEGLLGWIGEKRGERREQWLNDLWLKTSEAQHLATAPTTRVIHNNN
ncbi:hypothetical protein J6W91_02735 [Candidatus Saccharibacteria bacterium]|nr:hypothetical protein [Candidatus Saccharibacteria bacterium]